jgi:hypothetical protein
MLGWRPMFNLEQAMGLTVDWYRQFFADPANGLVAKGQLAG